MKNQDNTDEKKKKIKKKVIGGATAAGLGISVLLAGLFQSPGELTKKNAETIKRQEAPVVMMMDMDEENADQDDDGLDDTEDEEKGFSAGSEKRS